MTSRFINDLGLRLKERDSHVVANSAVFGHATLESLLLDGPVQATISRGTSSGGSVTLTGSIMKVTTESLSIVAGGTFFVAVNNRASVNAAAVYCCMNTVPEGPQEGPYIERAVPNNGNISVKIRNPNASTFNGSVQFSLLLVLPS